MSILQMQLVYGVRPLNARGQARARKRGRRRAEYGARRLRHASVRQLLTVGSSYEERALPASHTRTAVNTVFGRGYKNRLPAYTSRPSTVTRSSPSFPRCVSTCVSAP